MAGRRREEQEEEEWTYVWSEDFSGIGQGHVARELEEEGFARGGEKGELHVALMRLVSRVDVCVARRGAAVLPHAASNSDLLTFSR
jgi:hypothetical protein